MTRRKPLFLTEMIGNADGVSAEALQAEWEEYHGKATHTECRTCELADWLNGFDAFGMHPQPYMGDQESGLYRGQPVVWDGCFECIGGQLRYVGSAGCSGSGGPAMRAIVLEDRILFL